MRLIDADALMDALGIADDCQDCQYQSSIFCSRSPDFVNACEAIADAPVIDAVPVVRCRDCKWYKTMYCKMDRWTDLITVYVAKEDDYCSYGEKWKGAKMYERWKDE